jgi:hypothetical protein
MFRSFIALLVVFTIVFLGIINPAYAASREADIMPRSFPITINNKGNDNSVYFNTSFNSSDDKRATEDLSEELLDSVINGIVTTAGVAIGGAVVCYAFDGIATAFFPPAAALAAFCPGVGAATGTASRLASAK